VWLTSSRRRQPLTPPPPPPPPNPNPLPMPILRNDETLLRAPLHTQHAGVMQDLATRSTRLGFIGLKRAPIA